MRDGGACQQGGVRRHPELAAAVQVPGAEHAGQLQRRQGATDDPVQQRQRRQQAKRQRRGRERQVQGGGGQVQSGKWKPSTSYCAALRSDRLYESCVVPALCIYF